ncbi:MAG: type II secretion system protein [Alphaproteobacteria bacterium]|nr:type II secretion system protein [Alphaproteobacteria bacterium]
MTVTRMRRRGRQAGFTLIETMVAGSISIFALMVAFTFLYQSADMARLLEARVGMNGEARAVMALLGEGHQIEVAPDSRYYGLRGMSHDDVTAHAAGTDFAMRADARLHLTDTDQTADSHGSHASQPFSVTCRAAGNPLPECTGTETVIVTGFVGAAPAITGDCADTGNGTACGVRESAAILRTRRVAVTITDPHLAFLSSLGRTTSAPAEVSETYRSAFTQHADD